MTQANPAADAATTTLPPRQPAPPIAAGLIVLLSAIAVTLCWTGYIASDDGFYYAGAREWLRDPPFGGISHWTTRYPVLFPLAGAIALFGEGETALGAAALGWYVAFLAICAAFAYRLGGGLVALLTTGMLATLPLVATAASIVNCDLPEATFLVAGAYLLSGEVGASRVDARRCLGAGFCFALAILCRETAGLALMGLAPIFLLGRPIPRKALLIGAAGGLAVILLEMLFQYSVSGDPLHRYTLASNHDDSLSRAANLEGNLLIHPLVDPLLVLLVNNEFGLLFWLTAAALIARVDRQLSSQQKGMLMLPAALGIACFVLVAVLGEKLVLNPRYFTIAAVPAMLVAALWLGRRSPRIRWVLWLGVIGANLALGSAQNGNPHWAAQALVRAATDHPDRTIVAPRAVLDRAELPLEWAGRRNVAEAGWVATLHLVEAEKASSGSVVVARYPSPPTPAGAIARLLHLDTVLPGSVGGRLLHPNPDMVLLAP